MSPLADEDPIPDRGALPPRASGRPGHGTEAIKAAAPPPPETMTIGRLSRRTGVPVKTLRVYEDLGFIYTVGRSEGNYRMFGEEALWCVGVVSGLRQLGLTLAEIKDLTAQYLGPSAEPVGPSLAKILDSVRHRTEQQIADLTVRLERIRRFESERSAELAGRNDFRAEDPRIQRGLTLPPGGGSMVS